MKKIVTLLFLLGMVCTASAWSDDVYLISSINSWDWSHITSGAGYSNKFSPKGSSGNEFLLTLDRATIKSNELYFIIRFEASGSYKDIRPNSSESDADVSSSEYVSYGNATGKSFKVTLNSDTDKLQIYVRWFKDDYNNERWGITVAQLKEYTVVWDNTGHDWEVVKAYTKDDIGNHPRIEWLGAWPGTTAESLGNNLYKATFYGTENAIPIFSESDGDEQTKDLNAVNYGVYVSLITKTPSGVLATISDAGIGTFCSSKDVTVPSGVTAAKYITAVGANNVLTTANFTDGIPANTGALIEGSAGTYTFPITDTPPTAASGNKLVHCLNTTFVEQTSGGNYNYILTKKTVSGTVATPMFYLVNENGNTVKGGRAYLQLSSPVTAREYYLLWDDTSSINDPKVTNDNPQVVYDLQGRRVQQPTKGGIYIVDGKKVIK